MVADSWNDLQGRTSINLLACCPRGAYFVSSIDATDMIEDAASLFKLLDKVVEEIGEENVVQVVKYLFLTFLTLLKCTRKRVPNKLFSSGFRHR
jgi:hypothetical protein